MEFILFMVFLGIFVGYFILTLQPVKAEYTGLLLLFGKPRKVFTGGGLKWIMLPAPLAEVVLFPTERKNYDVPMRRIMTREGYDKKYLLEDEDGNLTAQLKEGVPEDVEWHDSQPVDIDVVVYLSWPKLSEYLTMNENGQCIDKDGNILNEKQIKEAKRVAKERLFVDICKSYIEAPPPEDDELIAAFINNAVIDVVRGWASGETWTECSSLLHEASQEINEAVKGTNVRGFRVADVFERARMTDVEFTFSEVILPPKLQEALGGREIGRREGDQTREAAKGEAEATTLVGMAKAKVEAAKITQVAEAILANPEMGVVIKQLQTLEAMASSESTIFAIAPNILESVSASSSSSEIATLIARALKPK